MIAPPPPPPPVARTVEMLDTECYRNYWLCKLYDIDSKQYSEFEMYEGHPLDREGLIRALVRAKIVTFNGLGYDVPMIACALAGFTCEQLKHVSDLIIVGVRVPGQEKNKKLQPWEVEKQFGAKLPNFLDHIDLMNVAPGDGSLKIYGGRLHCKRMQDLPIEPGATLSRADMANINTYCGNDLLTTEALFLELREDIETREELTRQYDVDMRSKSDAQIAESAFKKLLGLDYNACKELQAKAYLPPGFKFKYETPNFIKFKTPALQQTLAMIERAEFEISKNGSPIMPPELDDYVVKIGDSTYRMGIGGLHSTEEKTAHRADASYSLVDVDVVSYYPKIISILRMFPHQIGEVFLTIYDGWIEVRIEYKTAGNKKKAATFKIKINGAYGKTGSRFSIIYAPQMMIRTTITGQLCLFMLIERLSAVPGISAKSANTDGVVIMCARHLHPVRDAIIKLWEIETGFETEANEYMALYSRDVNSYMAFKPAYTDKKGIFHPVEIKSKGAYADPGLSKNPANTICVDAVKAYILDGVPVEKTIRQCSDIRKFVTVRAVRGGGDWVQDTIAAETVGAKRALLEKRMWAVNPVTKLWSDIFGGGVNLTLNDAIAACRTAIPRQYLGKAVRWYYGRGQTGHIAYSSNGNLVARSEGAKPCMELPDVLPCDINYDWYVKEANDLLVDVGCL